MTKTTKQGPLRVAIGAGGTGGHIYPALAVAASIRQLTRGNTAIHFFGAAGRLECTLVPEHGYPLHTNDITGIGGLRSLTMPFRLAAAAWQCARMLRRLRTDVVLGMGAYPSMPVIIGAWLARVPFVLHESNAIPGRANRFASHLTPHLAVALESAQHSFPGAEAARLVGMPLMPEIVHASSDDPRTAREHFGLRPGQRLIVISGGSLGARSLTRAASELAWLWEGRDDVRILVKTGRDIFSDVQRELAGNPIITVVEYLDRMDLAYAAADVFVGRSGSSTVSELAYLGVPSILVPYPHAPGDHQRHNAEALANVGGAILIYDASLSGAMLGQQIDQLLQRPDRLKKMGSAARTLHQAEAAETIARWLCELAGHTLESETRELDVVA